MDGKITKGIAGFYYVCGRDGLMYECKARGILRKDNIRPLTGDDVAFEITDSEKLKGNICSIHQRRNRLIRPAAANIDQAVIIFALKDPDPNLNLLDRFLIMMAAQDIPVIIFFNKSDLDRDGLAGIYSETYSGAGYKVLAGSIRNEGSVSMLMPVFKGKTTLLAGPSGVGKSTVTNTLLGIEHMEVGSLSEKLRRGKQTTRHTELITLSPDTFVLDTPGFTSLDVFETEPERLGYYYPEFSEAAGRCRFAVCSHVNESESICAVKAGVSDGSISRIRYANYVQLYKEIKAAERRY